MKVITILIEVQNYHDFFLYSLARNKLGHQSLHVFISL